MTFAPPFVIVELTILPGRIHVTVRTHEDEPYPDEDRRRAAAFFLSWPDLETMERELDEPPP